MQSSISDITLIIGIILGSAMLLGVIFVYVKNQTYGMGGTSLTVFGTLLIGLSIWKTAEISITPEGGLQAKFEAIERELMFVKQQSKDQNHKHQQQIQTLVTENNSLKTTSADLVKTINSVKAESIDLKRLNNENIKKIQTLTLQTDKLKEQNRVFKLDLDKVKSSSLQISNKLRRIDPQRFQAIQPNR